MEIVPQGSSGKKVVCIATGGSVGEAVQASKLLAAKGVAMSVWNAHCLKPFDEETTLKIAQGNSLFVTVEDHTVIGGLGSCVAEVFAKASSHPKLVKLGIQDLFGESGEPAELLEKHGISAAAIARTVSELA
jgi:transketolase